MMIIEWCWSENGRNSDDVPVLEIVQTTQTQYSAGARDKEIVLLGFDTDREEPRKQRSLKPSQFIYVEKQI
jgi:hypothetical protein